MKFNKYTTIFVLIFSSVFLAGCSSAPADDGGGEVQEDVRLVWWGTMHSQEVMQPLIDEYQSFFPNVTIEYSTARWNKSLPREDAASDYQEELDRVLSSNNSISIPDIFSIDSTWVGKYERYLQSAPADLYTSETYRSVFYDSIADIMVPVNSAGIPRVLGVPDYMDVYGVVYNNDMLIEGNPTNEIPENWNDFRDVARSLTERAPDSSIIRAGFAGGYGTNVEFSPEIFSLLMIQNDVDILSPFGVPTFASNDGNDSLSAFDFYKSFANGVNRTWSDDTTTFRNESAALLEENLAMAILPSWRYRQIEQMNQAYDLGLDLRVAKIPQLVGQDQNYYWSEYFANVVSAQRPNSTEAWRFLVWLSQPEQIRKISENTLREEGLFGVLSPRRDMAGDYVDNQYLSTFGEMLPESTNWNMVNGYRVRSTMRDTLNKQPTLDNLTTLESQIAGIMSSSRV